MSEDRVDDCFPVGGDPVSRQREVDYRRGFAQGAWYAINQFRIGVADLDDWYKAIDKWRLDAKRKTPKVEFPPRAA